MDKQKRNYYLIVLPIIVIAIILASCGIENAENPITPISIRQSTFTPTPSKKTTPDPSFTETMEPTLAYWATAQESRFEIEKIQIEQTKQAIFLLSNQFSQMCGYDPEGVRASPDGNWVATDCMWELFRVFQTNGNKIWDIPYSAIFEFYPEFLGSVKTLYWSEDGKYLYFANSSCCADTDATTNGDALYRLNLETGDWVLLVPGIFNYYSFSPDGDSLIYFLNNQASANESLDLHLLDIDSGKEETINAGNFERGHIVWKKDGQKISIIAQVGNLIEENSKYSLVSIDLQNKQAQTILLNTQNWLGIKDWSNDDILTISKSSAVEYHGDYVIVSDVVFYDLKNKLFITLTPTP